MALILSHAKLVALKVSNQDKIRPIVAVKDMRVSCIYYTKGGLFSKYIDILQVKVGQKMRELLKKSAKNKNIRLIIPYFAVFAMDM